jgi:alanine racemase
LDVTDVPGLVPGDAVTLIGGAAPSPDDLAARAGTIGYEILTSLGARYRRAYGAG